MKNIGEIIFKSLVKRKWLYIEYDSVSADRVTKFWISIKKINFENKKLTVDAYNVVKNDDVQEYTLLFEKIIVAEVLEGTITENKQYLIDFITQYEGENLFVSKPNMNNEILEYYEKCFIMDCVPYQKKYLLEQGIDADVIIENERIKLSKTSVARIASKLNYDIEDEGETNFQELAISILSVNIKEDLYVLIYKRLFLDVKEKSLTVESEYTINKEFHLLGIETNTKMSISNFIGESDLSLLNDFEKNRTEIMNLIDSNSSYKCTDNPYVCLINRKTTLNLSKEYEGIKKMYFEGTQTEPLKAFFREIKKSLKKKNNPIALINDDANLDQLLAIHSSMKHQVTYVQGPPGTGKTNTIVNLLVTALFNSRTALVCSFNNQPIDGIFSKMRSIKYNNKTVPFPCLRLGNKEMILKALVDIKSLYNEYKNTSVYESTIKKMFDENKVQAVELAQMLEEYEDALDLVERKEISDKMIKANDRNIKFKNMIKRKVSDSFYEVDMLKYSDESARKLIVNDPAFIKNLYYHCIGLIQKLRFPRFESLWDILNTDDLDEKYRMFTEYTSSDENLKYLLEVFPIIITTNISSSKLGSAKVHFNMTIMDEAGQCNSAVSLVPILRGESLVLVGDPQQLKPVILLDQDVNKKLRKVLSIPDNYDYIKNSIYKTFVDSDCYSNEILLKNHYRCHKDIINFNNKKFYNNQLVIKSKKSHSDALQLIDMKNNKPDKRNTSINEAQQIIKLVFSLQKSDTKSIGVITPFVNQANLINDYLKQNNIDDVVCGTIHTFQGDERDAIILSTALTSETSNRTYEWLSKNKELINVATSRAKDKLITLCSKSELDRLSYSVGIDDFKELIDYTESNGKSVVSEIKTPSRALGFKSFSTKTEDEFMETLSHALSVVENKCIMRKEVSIKSVFNKLEKDNKLFYTGVFDFVIFNKYGSKEYPVLAIELDGKEHFSEEDVMKRDKMKNDICKNHKLDIVRIKNEYSRRYNDIKDILEEFLKEEKYEIVQEILDI